ncbi:MAG: bifunctional oligoribonuclease/PAP phosphatase NrnA [Bacteroidales bacterium]|jgi:phosphoesterase RecJ-like protein|nr:bifunctional oligoribonuclease/PAP phosphatase NrnA [Bacteroidales bacterium]
MAKIEDIIDYLNLNDKFIITCHESPDGDALAAEYSLGKGLINLNKNIKILNSDPSPETFKFGDPIHLIKQYETEKDLPEDLENWTLLIVDTEKSNIGTISKILFDKVKNIIIIDHHNYGETNNPYIFLNPDAGSSCEIIYEILMKMNIDIELDIAIAIYTGIIYDTGSFAYPKTNAQAFHIAEHLVNLGVIPNKIYSRIYESKSIESIILQTLVHQNMELHYDQRVAVQYMSKKTLLDSGALYEEAQEIVNFPLQSEIVRVSVFFKEDSDGLLRCSIRSKGEVNCASVARIFNGGGHKTAAGFKCYEAFDIIHQRVLDILAEYFT